MPQIIYKKLFIILMMLTVLTILSEYKLQTYQWNHLSLRTHPNFNETPENININAFLIIIYAKFWWSGHIFSHAVSLDKSAQVTTHINIFTWIIFLYHHRSSDEVLHILSSILCAVQRARISLIIPKKKPIDELMKSRNMVRND